MIGKIDMKLNKEEMKQIIEICLNAKVFLITPVKVTDIRVSKRPEYPTFIVKIEEIKKVEKIK